MMNKRGLTGILMLVVFAMFSACSGGGGGGLGVTATYTIGGTISGLTGSGLVLQNNGGNDLSVDPNSTSFTFTTAIASGTAYSVTVLTQPGTPSQSCSVVNGSGTASANVSNIAINCTPRTELISRSTDDSVFGTYYDSESPVITPDGRYVAFVSYAANLASASNSNWHIFVRDRQTNQTELISVSSGSAGVQGNGNSFAPAISADGRYVVFESYATNLVANDTNNVRDIFLRDRQTSTTTRLSVGPGGVQADGESAQATLSADGHYVAFWSYATNLTATTVAASNVYLRDMQLGTNTLVSATPGGVAGNDVSNSPSISADGSRIAFWSYASDLVTNDTNGIWDIFLYDSNAATKIRLVSVATDGTQKNQGTDSVSRIVQPAISADGNVVAYSTTATNLVAGDTNGVQDVFLRNISTGMTIRASVGTGGVESNNDSPVGQGERIALSNDGSWVAFSTNASNIGNIATAGSNVLLRNIVSDTNYQVTTAGSSGATGPSLSGDGRFVAFGSAGSMDTRYASSGLFVQDRTSP